MSDLERVVTLTGFRVHLRRIGEDRPLCRMVVYATRPVSEMHDPSYYDAAATCATCKRRADQTEATPAR